MASPNFITGDMDSVTEDSLQRLDTLNCQQIYTPDQMETDCTKSLIAIQPYLQSTQVFFFCYFCSYRYFDFKSFFPFLDSKCIDND